jgi:hypothetical protein
MGGGGSLMSLFYVDGVEVDVGVVFKRVMNFGQAVEGWKVRRYLLRVSVDELIEKVGGDFDVFRQEVCEDVNPSPSEEDFLVEFRALGLPSMRELCSVYPRVLEGILLNYMYDRLLDGLLEANPYSKEAMYCVNSLDCVGVRDGEIVLSGDVWGGDAESG